MLVLSVVATGGSTPPVACTPRILTLEYASLPLLPTSHPHRHWSKQSYCYALSNLWYGGAHGDLAFMGMMLGVTITSATGGSPSLLSLMYMGSWGKAPHPVETLSRCEREHSAHTTTGRKAYDLSHRH